MPISILLVDDHAPFRGALRAMLGDDADFHVVGEAQDGETAVHMARDLEPDVVVMDIAMPGMGGVEATRQIVGHNPNISVIGLSMHASEAHRAAIVAAGAKCLVPKGDDARSLSQALRAWAPRQDGG